MVASGAFNLREPYSVLVYSVVELTTIAFVTEAIISCNIGGTSVVIQGDVQLRKIVL